MKTTSSRRFGIGAKLIIGLGSLIGIMVLIGGLAVASFLAVSGNSQDLAHQFLPEVIAVNQLERDTHLLRLWAKAYSLDLSEDSLNETKSAQKAIDDDLAKLATLLEQSPKLKKLKADLPQAEEAFRVYQQQISQTETLINSMITAREQMNQLSKQFLQAVDAFVGSQYSQLAVEGRTGARAATLLATIQKLRAGTDIRGWGNEILVGSLRSQAVQSQDAMNAVMPNFDKISGAADAAMPFASQSEERDTLRSLVRLAGDFKTAALAWVSASTNLQGLSAARLAASNQLVNLAVEISKAGASGGQNLAEVTSGLVGASSITVIVGLLIGILAGVLIAIFLIRAITAPLSLVTSLSRRLTLGDFSIQRQQVLSHDELGEMTEAFYDMVDGLRQKARIIEAIAEGVLTNAIPLASEDDGLGKSLQKMQQGLNEILTQVNVAVDQMASGADQVSTAAQSLSQGATEQAASLEQISASANEIHGQSKLNAENAMTANQLAKQASGDAQMGNEQMKGLMVLLDKMTKGSEETKSIVKTIDDIAFQVNLLALNANVEAARAGKYGKGFAVVAEEVRNLAVRSASAVNETTKMVEESIENIQQVNATAVKTGDQLQGILANANKVADFLEELAASSQEQARAMGQINGGLDQIDQVTQSNTASAEESASASEELSGQAQQLKVMVSRFQLSADALRQAEQRSVAAPVRADRADSKPSPDGSRPPSLLKRAMPVAARPREILLNDDFGSF